MGTNVFTAFSAEEKEDFSQKYMQHLKHRNGEPDLPNRTFSVRERFFSDLEENPVCRYGPAVVDLEAFRRNETRHKPEAGLDEATLWALAVAKSNRSERYGVEYALSSNDFANRGLDNPLTYIEIEEFYHTRVLEDVLSVVNLSMHQLPPHKITQNMLEVMIKLPKPVSNVMILCAEVAGVAAFSLLRDKAYELFDDQPESMQRIGDLFQQILVDEVGHVHYVRSQLGQARLGLARQILPLFSHYFMSDMPEYKLLFGRELMEKIVAADIDGAVAGYDDAFLP